MAVAILLLTAAIADWVCNLIIRQLVRRISAKSMANAEGLLVRQAITRFSHVVPALIIQRGIHTVPNLPEWAVTLVHNVTAAYIILMVARTISALLSFLNERYQRRPEANQKPIKGYIQIGKILIYCTAAILAIAALMDRSPLLLISGLGAMAAVLMLIFKDTILSLVASIQLNSTDMVRIGDWIEMPQLNADGDVIDVQLHTVKVQNFDKTITTIPTYRLVSESFRNWRGMSESGGRRIKRALKVDKNSIRFLTEDEIQDLRKFKLLDAYFEKKIPDVEEWNKQTAASGVNARRLTNIGTFRNYVQSYLENHPGIKKDFTLLVRHLAPGETGVPIEVYAFTNTTAWAEYEGIQADIFDHLFAIMPEFGLRLFQNPSGYDFSHLVSELKATDENGGNSVKTS